MSEVTFELVGSVAWSEGGLQDHILYAGAFGPDGGARMLNRATPGIFRGPDGTFWLMGKGQVVRLYDNMPSQKFSLTAADVDHTITIGPTLERGLVVFGRKGTENVLALLSPTGQPVWRQSGLDVLRRNLTEARLLVDFDGSVLLYIISGGIGEVLRIDLSDGAISAISKFDGEAPQKVWLNEDTLYWTEALGEGGYFWISQNLESGVRRAIGGPPLQYFLDYAQGPLPDGGAMLATPQRSELIWMRRDGSEAERLRLAGLVRGNDYLVVGLRDHDWLDITQWQDGQNIAYFRTSSFDEFSRVIDAEQGNCYVLNGRRLVVFDWRGTQINEFSSSEVNRERIQREGRISVSNLVVEPSGSVVLVGADPEGAYLVRVTSDRDLP